MSKKLFGGGKKKAAAPVAEAKGPIVTPLAEGSVTAQKARRRFRPAPTILGLSSTLGG